MTVTRRAKGSVFIRPCRSCHSFFIHRITKRTPRQHRRHTIPIRLFFISVRCLMRAARLMQKPRHTPQQNRPLMVFRITKGTMSPEPIFSVTASGIRAIVTSATSNTSEGTFDSRPPCTSSVSGLRPATLIRPTKLSASTARETSRIT